MAFSKIQPIFITCFFYNMLFSSYIYSKDSINFWSDEYLRPFSSNGKLHSNNNKQFAKIISNHIKWRWVKNNKKQTIKLSKKKHHGLCHRSIKKTFNHLSTVLQPFLKQKNYSIKFLTDPDKNSKSFWAERSAEDFRKWALKNPVSLCHQMRMILSKNKIPPPPKVGHIYLYKKGACGFNKKYGHIEVITKTAPLIACSDGCRKIHSCKPTHILIPMWNCSELLLKGS